MSRPFRPCLTVLLLIGTGVVLGARPAEAQQASPLIINEIFYNPADDGERREFVELYNRSSETVDLEAYALADANRDPASLPALTVPPGDYVVLARDATALRAAFPGASPVALEDWPTLNNGGDSVLLLRAGAVGDSVAYTPDWGGENGRSLERIDPDGPARAVNFGTSKAAAGATPGVRNSIFDPDIAPPHPVFAEKTAARTVTVFFSEPLAAASVAADAFVIGGLVPVSAQLAGNGKRVLLHFSGAVVGEALTMLTIRGVRDLFGNALGEATVPVSTPAQPGEVVVNEVLYAPLADDFDGRPDQPEYIELYNRTGRSITLRGVFWTDRPDEEGQADTLRIAPSRLVSIAPGSYAVLYARSEPHVLTDAYPALDTTGADVALVGLDRSSLGLLNGGSLVHLHRAEGVTLDSVYYDPDWQAPSLEDDTGVALERIAPGGPSNNPTNWTSSAAEAGGTPGQPNSITLPPVEPRAGGGLQIAPSPFSPDGDGFEDVTAIRYTLDEPTALLRLRIFDSYGRLVYSEEARLSGRTGQFLWNGRSDAGHRLRIGIYVVLLEALSVEGGTVASFKAPVVLARLLD